MRLLASSPSPPVDFAKVHSKSEKEPKLPYKSDKFRRLILSKQSELLSCYLLHMRGRKNENKNDFFFCSEYIF